MKSPSSVLCALLPVALAGCAGATTTEVVVVLQSDLVVPTETDGVEVLVSAGPFAPNPNSRQSINESAVLTGDFPFSLSFVPGDKTTAFSLTVQLLLNVSPEGVSPPSVIVSRTITDARFSTHRKMMLVVPMPRACACHGTSCPGQGNPDCDDLDAPTLQPFDPAISPPGAPLFGMIELATATSATQ